jgi:hypothetical protein
LHGSHETPASLAQKDPGVIALHGMMVKCAHREAARSACVDRPRAANVAGVDLDHWGAPHMAQSNRSAFWTSVKCRLENAGGMAPTLTSMAACSAWALALAY